MDLHHQGNSVLWVLPEGFFFRFDLIKNSFLHFQAEKRAVHNALERKRRDHIKDMFSQLKGFRA